MSVHSGASSTVMVVSNEEMVIPNHWRPEVEDCLKKKLLTMNARNEIVRNLVSQLFSRCSRPNHTDCEKLSR